MKSEILYRFLAVFVVLFLLGGAVMSFNIKSRSFENEGVIPSVFTCDGEDISPDLEWSQPPEGTKSFAIICDDPDAPSKVWVHWVFYNIPSDVRSLPKGVALGEVLKDGSRQGHTDSNTDGYSGPCPPHGKPHRYFFKIYALDSSLEIEGQVTKDKLLKAMEGHILAESQIMGTYKR